MGDINQYKARIKQKIQQLINEGNISEAKDLIVKYEETIKDDIEIYSIKAVLLIMTNELDEAEEILKDALSLDKNNPDILFNLAYIYEVKGQYNEAYRYYLDSKSKSKDSEFISNVDEIINTLKENYNLDTNNSNSVEASTSIIILTYNKLDYTKLCIDSIRKYTKKGTYEIIVVDNNSTDDTRKWLKEQRDLRIILNSENLGFPGGCNVGIKAAERENDILLLNNDTIVTSNWLENLKKCLYSDDCIGAVGAVTNNCANYQAINTNYKSIDEMLSFAEEYNISDAAKWEQKVRLIGYCMLIKRSIIDKIGLLDERFFPGNFEDDDLGYRIQAEGYKLILCNDTFIHHFGSTSFRDNPEKFNNTLKNNSLKFINKWEFDSEENSIVNNNIINKIDTTRPNISVLHIGCGTGALLYKIKYIFKDSRVYGMDSNKITSKILSNFIDVKVANLDNNLDYPENYFDYIIVTNSIENSKHTKKSLCRLLRFIKERGKLIVTIKNSNYYEEIVKTLMGNSGLRDNNMYRRFNYNEIKEIFSDDIFPNAIVQSETVNMSSENNKVLDYICKLTGENMKSQYITKEYLVTLEKDAADKKEIEYILRRIENSIDIEENLNLLNIQLNNTKYDMLNEIVMKSIIKKEIVFNIIAIYLYNNGKSVDALKILELAYKYNPKYKDTVLNISYIIYKLGETETALTYLDSFSNDDEDVLRLKEELLGDTNE